MWWVRQSPIEILSVRSILNQPPTFACHVNGEHPAVQHKAGTSKVRKVVVGDDPGTHLARPCRLSRKAVSDLNPQAPVPTWP